MTTDDWFTRAPMYPIPELGILRPLMMSSVCIDPRWSYIGRYETPAWSSTGAPPTTMHNIAYYIIIHRSTSI